LVVGSDELKRKKDVQGWSRMLVAAGNRDGKDPNGEALEAFNTEKRRENCARASGQRLLHAIGEHHRRGD